MLKSILNQNWDKYYFLRHKMVIKVDKSEEFKKSGRKLISEYDGHEYYDEKEEEKPQFLNENSTTT